MTKTEVRKMLEAHRNMEIVKHSNPKGLGPRRYLTMERNQFVFLRPTGPTTEESSYLHYTTSLDIVQTEKGFTLYNGLIEYEWRTP